MNTMTSTWTTTTSRRQRRRRRRTRPSAVSTTSLCSTLLLCWSFCASQVVSGQEQDQLLQFKLHHRPDSRRRLPSLLGGRPDKNHVPAAKYEGPGVQFMDIWMGTPAVKRVLAVQTSSDYTALPCEGCAEEYCGKERDVFVESQSSTFEAAPCDACAAAEGVQCQDNMCVMSHSQFDLSSWVGHLARDTVYVGGSVEEPSPDITTTSEFSFPMDFVCQRATTGMYTDQVMDGVLSFSSSEGSLVSQMQKAGKLGKPRFSTCFNPTTSASDMGGDGAGVVTLGGYDAQVLNSPMLYTPNVPANGIGYRVIIKRIHLRAGGGQTALTEPHHVVQTMELPQGSTGAASVDSAVPYLTFEEGFREGFMDLWKQVTGADFDFGKMDLQDDAILGMPTILLELEGHPWNKQLALDGVPTLTSHHHVLLAIPATHYMEKNLAYSTKPYRARIQFDGDHTILATSAMKGHNVVFELDTQRIGFAEVNSCEHPVGLGTALDIVEAGLEQAGLPQDQQQQQQQPPPGEEDAASVVDINHPNIIVADNTGGFVMDVPQLAFANAIDDDMFATPQGTPGGSQIPKNKDPLVGGRGGGDGGPEGFVTYTGMQGQCVSAQCRCFLALGYVMVGTALAVAYRMSRPKEQRLSKERPSPSELFASMMQSSSQSNNNNNNNMDDDGYGDQGSVGRGGSVASMSRRSRGTIADQGTIASRMMDEGTIASASMV